MSEKKFNKKFMHPTRRKLVDMVLQGNEYETDTKLGYDSGERSRKREVGEVWTDSDGITWEQFSYGRVQQSKLTETMAEVRNWISTRNKCKNDTCSKSKYGYTDKKLIRKTGYCSNCLIDKESKIKEDGLWAEYEQYRIIQNMISHGSDVLSQLNQAYSDIKQEYEYVNEDGSIEKWKMERDVDELKSEILGDIENISKEVIQLKEIRNKLWDVLKDKNYDLLNEPID
jgi:hypothetical protein